MISRHLRLPAELDLHESHRMARLLCTQKIRDIAVSRVLQVMHPVLLVRTFSS
jgi:hypothetical protein